MLRFLLMYMIFLVLMLRRLSIHPARFKFFLLFYLVYKRALLQWFIVFSVFVERKVSLHILF